MRSVLLPTRLQTSAERVGIVHPLSIIKQITAGDGRLAGDFPDGVTRKDGAPHSADVRVLLRTSNPGFDGAVIRKTRSAQDGTWEAVGLNPAMTYDVVARLDGYNDMILSRVRPQSPTYTPTEPIPELPAPLAIRGIMDGLTQLEDAATVLVSGGVPPYSLIVVAGSLPPSAIDRQISPFDNGIFIVVFDAPVSPGAYSWTLRATDSEGATVELSESVTQA